MNRPPASVAAEKPGPAREAAGLPRGSGPINVVSTLALMDYEPATCRMRLVATNPGDWMIHCHLPHHMMNAMVSMVGPMSEPAGSGAGRA